MLKPKFNNIDELVGEFYGSLDYLDERLPKDKSLRESAKPASKPVVTESKPVVKAKEPVVAEDAFLSMYSSGQRALDSFRVLAGIEERVIMPWNASMGAETRSVGMLEEQWEMGHDNYGEAEDDDEKEGEDEVDEDDEDGMEEDFSRDSRGLGGLGSAEPKYKKDLSDRYSPKALHRAVSQSARTLANSHAAHDTMQHLPSADRDEMKAKLAQHHAHAAHSLRIAASGAPDHVADMAHSLADRHQRHSNIYAKGGRPKLEAIEEMQAVVESIDPIDYFHTALK